jgi:hypothetical protein
LVATFSNLHRTIAELKADGTIEWKTEPNLMLMRNGKEEGKILHLRPTTPNNWEVAICKDTWDAVYFYRLQSLPQFQRPKEKPYTETDRSTA